MGTITFRNFTQKILWDNEISGQLSDGMWENSGVDRKIWSADSKVGTPGVNFHVYGRANFNFASSELLEIIGDRMLMMAKASKITKDEKTIRNAESLEGVKDEESFKRLKPKFPWKIAKLVLETPYSMTNLIADLKDMSRTVSLAGNRPSERLSTKSIPDRDLQRVMDIISKAGGDLGKEVQLTTLMANMTKDRTKLQYRGDAMKELGKPRLAKIFYDKLNESKSLKYKLLTEAQKQIYFDSYAGATNYVHDEVSKKYEINQDDWFAYVSVGGKPKNGTTKRSSGIRLMDKKTGKELSKALNIQVYRMKPDRFELNYYIS